MMPTPLRRVASGATRDNGVDPIGVLVGSTPRVGLPVAAVLVCLWLMLNVTAPTWLRFPVWVALGLLVYFGYGRNRSVPAQCECEQLDGEKA